MTVEQYLEYQQRLSDAATIEDLDVIGEEIQKDHAEDSHFEALMDSYVHVRILMQSEDGEEPRDLMQGSYDARKAEKRGPK